MSKIKLTVGELTVMPQFLAKLLDVKMPIGTSYQVARLTAKLDAELQILDTRRQAIAKKHDINIAGGIDIAPDHPKYAVLKKDLDLLAAESLTISLDIVKLPKKIEIEPSVLLVLDKLITLET